MRLNYYIVPLDFIALALWILKSNFNDIQLKWIFYAYSRIKNKTTSPPTTCQNIPTVYNTYGCVIGGHWV